LNPQLTPLIELQTLDLRLMEIKDQQRKTPDLIQSAETPLKDAQQAFKQATSSVEALVKERRDKERDLEAQEDHISKLRGRLTELKTNKEYQAHLFEIEMANKKKGEIEDQILLLMERIEKHQQDAKQAQTKSAEAERVFKQEKSRLEQLLADLSGELAQLEQKHQEIAVRVDKASLERYRKLKAMRKDLAVVPVRNGNCTGCRLQLPPQLVAEVKRSDQLLACSYCHRILYWEGDHADLAKVSPGSLDNAESDVQETV